MIKQFKGALMSKDLELTIMELRVGSKVQWLKDTFECEVKSIDFNKKIIYYKGDECDTFEEFDNLRTVDGFINGVPINKISMVYIVNDSMNEAENGIMLKIQQYAESVKSDVNSCAKTPELAAYLLDKYVCGCYETLCSLNEVRLKNFALEVLKIGYSLCNSIWPEFEKCKELNLKLYRKHQL